MYRRRYKMKKMLLIVLVIVAVILLRNYQKEREEADFETKYSNMGEKSQKELMEKRVFFWNLLLDNLMNSNSKI